MNPVIALKLSEKIKLSIKNDKPKNSIINISNMEKPSGGKIGIDKALIYYQRGDPVPYDPIKYRNNISEFTNLKNEKIKIASKIATKLKKNKKLI
jgi:hypothetical protein